MISGAGRGIGRSIALILASEGANVVCVVDKLIQEAMSVVSEIVSLGSSAMAIKADISVSSEVKRTVHSALERFGRIDILVNNAAILEQADFMTMSELTFDETINVNLRGAFLCSQVVAKEMRKQERGKIINILSIGTELVDYGASAYSASKGGLRSLTKAMALELAPYKINVNAISPGPTYTQGARKTRSDDELEARRIAVPLGRLGEPEDVAKVALFLASHDSDFITGQVITVDGGLSIVVPYSVLVRQRKPM